jgi:hypothetical protein
MDAMIKGKLQLYDDKDMATGEVVDVIHCSHCGAVVFDMNRHIAWHKSIDRKFAEIPAHNWDLGGR